MISSRLLPSGSCLVGCLLALGIASAAAEPPPHSELVFPGPDGRLIYQPLENGDTILDFSNCGYRGGGVALPDAPVRETLEPDPEATDDTARIQAAIDRVSALPLGADGLRGAVLLRRGEYRVPGTLRIAASGVVLRGEGQGPDGTVLLATGTAKRTLITISGESSLQEIGDRQAVTDERVPVGARHLHVADGSAFQPGDTVLVLRHGNEAWIREINMDRILPRMAKRDDGSEYDQTRQWSPFHLSFDRVIVAVEGNRLTLDAPIACAIEPQWGGGHVVTYEAPGRIDNVGVEHLRSVSDFDPTVTRPHWASNKRRGERYLADEKHAWRFVSINHATNVWARNLTALHYGLGCVGVGTSAKWVTVQDSVNLDQVSLITGSRRYPFATSGQLTLFQRNACDDTPRHGYAMGARVAGPNVFLDCFTLDPFAYSEPHHRWSVGGLFDNVHCRIALQDRQNYGTGHGWSGANYVAWNTVRFLICQQPPTAQNFAIGHVGEKHPGSFRQRGIRWEEENPGQTAPVQMNQTDGWWEHHGSHVAPRSLYLRQLEDRLGREAVEAIATPAQLQGPIHDELKEQVLRK